MRRRNVKFFIKKDKTSVNNIIMKELAIHLLLLNRYAYIAHHFVGRNTFFSDHEYLGELYNKYDDLYDSVVERMIGLGQKPDEFGINNEAIAKLNNYQQNLNKNAAYFIIILSLEKELCMLINNLNSNASLGTQNFLQGIADESEQRQYKLKQRLDAELVS